MPDKDVTALVDFENNDDECLPITKCVCGAKFPSWDRTISVYRDWANPCSECGRKLYFSFRITVFEVTEDA